MSVALLASALGATHARAAEVIGGKTYLVLGVIASAEPDEGVALLKRMEGSEAFAARAGQEIDKELSIARITRDYVYFRYKGHMERVKVGEQVDMAAAATNASVFDAAGTGIERRGNTVTISASLREHVVKEKLSKVLMQAAAVPYYEGGELKGFRLWDIDEGSIYDKAGFADGDIVTAINGQPLSDVGNTIRMLQSLRSETRADVSFIRKGVPQTVEIVIQ